MVREPSREVDEIGSNLGGYLKVRKWLQEAGGGYGWQNGWTKNIKA